MLVAYFLDIAHPPGSPLYGQLANVLALLPWGPIAWRVNLFSTLVGTLNLVLGFIISLQVLKRSFSSRHPSMTALAFFPPLLLLLCPAYLKQITSAEVKQHICC